MIKRIFGFLVVVSTLAVIAFAIINRQNYRSILFTESPKVLEESVEPLEPILEDSVEVPTDEPPVEADSLQTKSEEPLLLE